MRVGRVGDAKTDKDKVADDVFVVSSPSRVTSAYFEEKGMTYAKMVVR